MRCMDSMPDAEKERRVRWGEVCEAKATAQELVTKSARAVAAAGPREMSAALGMLARAVRLLDLAEDGLQTFRREKR